MHNCAVSNFQIKPFVEDSGTHSHAWEACVLAVVLISLV